MLKGIKNIILDLGGVIINLNQALTNQAFRQLLPDSHHEIWEKSKTQQIFEKYETNQISTSEFIAFFKSYNPLINENEIVSAWNKMLLDIPQERIALIENLSKNYNLLLLSNTNELHYSFIEEYYQNDFNKGSFGSLFQKTYLSFKIGLRKPETEIFEFVLKDGKLDPERTLFIDDSSEHLTSAQKLNIRTQHVNLNKQQSLTTLFNGN